MNQYLRRAEVSANGEKKREKKEKRKHKNTVYKTCGMLQEQYFKGNWQLQMLYKKEKDVKSITKYFILKNQKKQQQPNPKKMERLSYDYSKH